MLKVIGETALFLVIMAVVVGVIDEYCVDKGMTGNQKVALHISGIVAVFGAFLLLFLANR